MRKLFVSFAIGGTIFLHGCSEFSGTMLTRDAIAGPITDQPDQMAQVNFLSVVDPLSLGAERMSKLGRLESRNTNEALAAALVDNAIEGFYDPRYPAMMCGDVPGTDVFIDERSREICQAAFGRRPADPFESPVENVVRTVTRHVKEIETAKTDATGKVIRGTLNTRRSIEKVEVGLKVNTKTFETPLEAFQRLRRNRIQDRLMQASNLRCTEYVEEIRLRREASKGLFGGLDVTLDAAATIFSGVAPVLSALSGVTTGIQGATDQAGFNRIAMEVMVKGIATAREKWRTKISGRQPLSIAAYSLQDALADVAQFHGSCSVIAGLNEADGAVSTNLKQVEKGENGGSS